MGIFKKADQDVDVRIDQVLAIAVSAFHEDHRDLELVRETVDMITHGTEAQRRNAVFALLYACAQFSDAVALDNPGMDEGAFVEAIFKNVVDQMAI